MSHLEQLPQSIQKNVNKEANPASGRASVGGLPLSHDCKAQERLLLDVGVLTGPMYANEQFGRSYICLTYFVLVKASLS